MIYCPFLANSYWGPLTSSSLAAKQHSGLFVAQLQDSGAISYNNLCGTSNSSPILGPLSTTEVFGITSTANARYLPYAAKFALKLLIPAACRTSGYYKGRLPLSSFNGNDAILSMNNSVKLANLISLADSLNDLDDINFS